MTVITATQHVPVEQHFDHLWHLCRTHTYDGDCGLGAGCVSFCGQERTTEGTDIPESQVDPADVCVVCDSMWEAA